MKKPTILLAFLLCGCAQGEVIYMKNAQGETVQCGPYTVSAVGGSPDSVMGSVDARGNSQLRQCVVDYEVAGYRRAPAPSK